MYENSQGCSAQRCAICKRTDTEPGLFGPNTLLSAKGQNLEAEQGFSVQLLAICKGLKQTMALRSNYLPSANAQEQTRALRLELFIYKSTKADQGSLYNYLPSAKGQKQTRAVRSNYSLSVTGQKQSKAPRPWTNRATALRPELFAICKIHKSRAGLHDPITFYLPLDRWGPSSISFCHAIISRTRVSSQSVSTPSTENQS